MSEQLESHRGRATSPAAFAGAGGWRPRSVAAAVVIVVIAASFAAAQEQAASLAIGGDVPRPLTLGAADLKQMPRTSVNAQQEGRTVVYEGVTLAVILGRAGVPLGAELRGPALATYVLATATDGYQVVFSLGELDPAMTSADMIVADTIDGKPLPDPMGPLRIVVPSDKRGARSVRMLVRLDVVRLRK